MTSWGEENIKREKIKAERNDKHHEAANCTSETGRYLHIFSERRQKPWQKDNTDSGI